MTDLQIFDALCDIISRQAKLIRELILQLKELDAISDETADALHELEKDYDAAAGNPN